MKRSSRQRLAPVRGVLAAADIDRAVRTLFVATLAASAAYACGFLWLESFPPSSDIGQWCRHNLSNRTIKAAGVMGAFSGLAASWAVAWQYRVVGWALRMLAVLVFALTGLVAGGDVVPPEGKTAWLLASLTVAGVLCLWIALQCLPRAPNPRENR